MSSPTVKEQRLSDIVQNLKFFYKEKDLKDISIQFCFICVLHLANEKNLNMSLIDGHCTISGGDQV